ncbi:hypothetical protein [Anaerococcus sp. Marseille-Q5996]|uniref:hypothetical protein n=1 Tax=Anaerococcus sp. Marseille-Q5996 TaxID=2972769 RepID=UPI0021C71FCF|nr:hypothetical protein [Anaerococcus sp. Marseille-Q5996]
MKVYVINGPKAIGKTDFSVNLAEYLQQNNKVLLIQGKRATTSNIEDYFQKDGMITYDLADYFTGLAPLERVLVHENDNLDFIISPLLEDKYEIKGEDINNLLNNISYDFVVIDGVDKNLISNKTSVDIIGENDLALVNESDAFFINKTSDDFDIRNHKDTIDAKSSKYLGTVKNGEYFKNVIENLIAGKEVEIPKLGFFEKLKASFRK